MRIENILAEYSARGKPITGVSTIPRRFWYGGRRHLLILTPLREYEVRANRYYWYTDCLYFILENLDPLSFCLTPRYPPANYAYNGTVIFGDVEHRSRGPKLHLPDYDSYEDDHYYHLSLSVVKINSFLANLGDKQFHSGHQKKA